LVEGNLTGGYEMGIESAVKLVERLNSVYGEQLGKPVELMVVGRVSEEVKHVWRSRTDIPLIWLGKVSVERIPEIDRSAHLLYAADINPACPNAVIEALACGTPVLSFDTGALPELVTGDAGRVVPYGGDSWALDQPDIPALAKNAVEILQNQDHFRAAARTHAEADFGLDQMMEAYLSFILKE
jgi:glycosyltransferase involved in cell wall biosynthesis